MALNFQPMLFFQAECKRLDWAAMADGREDPAGAAGGKLNFRCVG